MKTIGEIRKARRVIDEKLSLANGYLDDITEELYNRVQEGQDEIDYVLWDGTYEYDGELITSLLKELRGKGFDAKIKMGKAPRGGPRTILVVGIKTKIKHRLLKRGILRFLIVAMIVIITLICILL